MARKHRSLALSAGSSGTSPRRASRGIAGILLTVLMFAPPVHAANPLAQATEWTQLLNNAELINLGALESNQLGVQVDQLSAQLDLVRGQLMAYRNMIQNTLNLPETIWGEASLTLRELRGLYEEANMLATKGAQLDEFLASGLVNDPLYAGSGYSAGNYAERYDRWVERSQSALAGTLSANRLTMEDVAEEARLIERIEDQGKTVNGQVEAIQVGNELAASLARQMTQLRAITAAQGEAAAIYQARTLASMDAEEAQKRANVEALMNQGGGSINLFGRFTSGAWRNPGN